MKIIRSYSLAILILVGAAASQTFEINGQSPQQPQKAPAKNAKSGNKPAAGGNASSNGLSWGTSIDVSRQARAAEQAIKRGDYATAANFAEKAANAAPQNAQDTCNPMNQASDYGFYFCDLLPG